jgi:hypothetical protein
MRDLAGVHPYVWLLSYSPPTNNQPFIFIFIFFFFSPSIRRHSRRIVSSGKNYSESGISTVMEIGVISRYILPTIYLCEGQPMNTPLTFHIRTSDKGPGTKYAIYERYLRKPN